MPAERLARPYGLAGAVWRQPVPAGRPHARHAELEVCVVTGGSCRMHVAGTAVELGPGDLLHVGPGQPHGLLRAGRDLRMWVVAADPDAVPAPAAPGGRVVRLRGADLQWLQSRLVELALLTDDAPRFNAGLAYVVLSALRLGEQPHPRPVRRAVLDALTRLDAGPGAPPLPELAAAVGLSTSQLARSFRAATGMSVLEYRHHQQVRRYLELYGAGRYRSSADAAHAAGFGSYAQFSRVFRKVTGCSPTQYRRGAPGAQPDR